MEPQYPEPQYPDSEEQTFWSKFKNNLIELIEFIAVLGAIFIIIRFFIAEPHRVSGSSMVPNFHDGDYLITNKVSVKLSHPKRGEVIILQNPRNPDQVFIKRVIGLPLEKVMIGSSNVYINGLPLAEPYLPQGTITSGENFLKEREEITIPEGQYFVMGDNRGGSSDSREWGPIKEELIVGQAYFRYWPPQKITLLKVDTPSL